MDDLVKELVLAAKYTIAFYCGGDPNLADCLARLQLAVAAVEERDDGGG